MDGKGDGLNEGKSEGIADVDGGGDGIVEGKADGRAEGAVGTTSSCAFRGWGKNQYWSGPASLTFEFTRWKVDWGLVSRIRSLKLKAEGELDGISEGIVEGRAEGVVETSSCVIRGWGKNQYCSVSSASFTFDLASPLAAGWG
jgi:hypothetical protein